MKICLSLSLYDARGQACDSSFSTLGGSGVTQCVQDVSPKVLPIHFFGDCLNLVANAVIIVSKGMKDYMEVCLEIIK